MKKFSKIFRFFFEILKFFQKNFDNFFVFPSSPIFLMVTSDPKNRFFAYFRILHRHLITIVWNFSKNIFCNFSLKNMWIHVNCEPRRELKWVEQNTPNVEKIMSPFSKKRAHALISVSKSDGLTTRKVTITMRHFAGREPVRFTDRNWRMSPFLWKRAYEKTFSEYVFVTKKKRHTRAM